MRRRDTLLQHGDALAGDDNSVAPPIYPSATFRAGDAGEFAEMASRQRHPRYYTRYGNPTLQRTAQLIARLEGGEAALMTSSGMGAMSLAVLSLVASGDHVVAQTNHYMGTSRLLAEVLARFGVRASFVDQTDAGAFEAAFEPATRLVVLESPANPTLALTDIAAVAKMARARGALTIADNTFASPINQRPLELGVDVVVHSATKYLGGHHDLTAGAVVCSESLVARMWDTAIVLGGVLSPHDAWLLLRGMRTLSVRVERANGSALRVAQFLERHPGVERVHYPGLASHPQHALARAQMSGFGGVLAFQVRGGYAETERLMSRLQVFTQAVSLGGVESLAAHAAVVWAGTLSDEAMLRAGIQPNLVRLAIGLEDVADLTDDLGQALGG
ncbi:MAG: aminotransferase class I/II-fold pyridoxal phosphate-dependent enzyme [Burkholderiaceae bacterium]|nr:aminotransferase class I/II-fold pyridoxal phosphate-dependent enzyme [Burkholderiaceae bacterium]